MSGYEAALDKRVVERTPASLLLRMQKLRAHLAMGSF